MNSFICLTFALCAFTGIRAAMYGGGCDYADGWVEAPGSIGECIKLIEPEDRLYNPQPKNAIEPLPPSPMVPFQYAEAECMLQGGHVVHTVTQQDNADLKQWLLANYPSYFKRGDGSGYWPKNNGVWIGYRRKEVQANELNYDVQYVLRLDPMAYMKIPISCPPQVMPRELWREVGVDQPNDDSVRLNDANPEVYDERCVMMKQINNPANIGLDDWDCEEGFNYIVCQKCEDECPKYV